MATLAALDIVHACNLSATNVSCYTFGCPRVGNHAFADAYAAAVPDTWHVINGQDVVVHSMKFWGWYKRDGNRVRARRSPCKVSENLQLYCLIADAVRHMWTGTWRHMCSEASHAIPPTT